MMKIVVALFFASALLHAQSWVKANASDPMTGKTFSAFELKGKIMDSDTLAGLEVRCSGGKFREAGFVVDGMTFHYDGYASLRNPPYVTNVRVRTGKKIESKAFLVSQNMKIAQVSRQEIEKMISAGGAIIEFADGPGTIHYADFTGASFTSDLKSECGW